MDISEIRGHFGPGGIRDFAPVYGRLGAITDDTQMTLFTAEGILRAASQLPDRVPMVVHRAYMRWLRTQGYSPPKLGYEIVSDDWLFDGWLIGVQTLWSKRAPGNTCLSALRNAKKMGRPAVNNSKGCGGVMRVAPVGLAVNRDDAFELGSQTAALTHGHSSG
jgi:ADP-ribosylglycohydrolase